MKRLQRYELSSGVSLSAHAADSVQLSEGARIKAAERGLGHVFVLRISKDSINERAKANRQKYGQLKDDAEGGWLLDERDALHTITAYVPGTPECMNHLEHIKLASMEDVAHVLQTMADVAEVPYQKPRGRKGRHGRG